MANTATLIASIPAHFQNASYKGLIQAKAVVFDTADSDLEVYEPSTGAYGAILGLTYKEASAHTLTFKSASTTLLALEQAANSGVEWPLRIKEPYVVGKKGEKLYLRCTTAVVSSILLYVAEFSFLKID
jgi:hypothetical protein